ncbi:hypothetical protein F5883DRAFT_549277 [Diaporthe sp. PMI_573]|nr:hypothetical protein F5883DRAFT_549277 [Diaporthaceae sp. PMI_573]
MPWFELALLPCSWVIQGGESGPPSFGLRMRLASSCSTQRTTTARCKPPSFPLAIGLFHYREIQNHSFSAHQSWVRWEAHSPLRDVTVASYHCAAATRRPHLAREMVPSPDILLVHDSCSRCSSRKISSSTRGARTRAQAGRVTCTSGIHKWNIRMREALCPSRWPA